MKAGEAGNRIWLAIRIARLAPEPFWRYEEIGAFFLQHIQSAPVSRVSLVLAYESSATRTNTGGGRRYFAPITSVSYPIKGDVKKKILPLPSEGT
jgi:hypothetical protein